MPSVMDFGARGDGRTDDTAAVQRAVREGGGPLCFPKGTYLLSRPIEVTLAECGRFGLAGADGCATLVMAGPGPALHLVGSHAGTASPDSLSPAVLANERLPLLGAIEIVGAHPQAVGLRLEGLWEPVVSAVTIRDCLHGIHVVRRNRNLILSACHLHNNRGVGIFYDQVNLHQSNILGCHISYNRGAGIKVLESEIRNLQITGNDIEYNYDPSATESADVWIETLSASVREGTLASNTIQAVPSPGGANVRIRGCDDLARHKAGHWTLSGNLISSQRLNVHLQYVRGVTVTGNAFFSGHERTLLVEQSEQVVIGSNCIDRNPDYRVPAGDGVVFDRCHGCLMTGTLLAGVRATDTRAAAAVAVLRSSAVRITACEILDAEPCGVLLADSSHCAVSQCTILDRQTPSRLLDPIRVTGGGQNQVAGNLTR